MQGTQKTGTMGHELSVATCLASVLVGCIMRTSAIIFVLGQSHCPCRLAAAHSQSKDRDLCRALMAGPKGVLCVCMTML